MSHFARATIASLVFAPMSIASDASATEVTLGGTYTPAEISKACTDRGGEVLGIDEHGHYGCDNAKDNTVILCNNKGKCKGFLPAITPAAKNKVLSGLGLKS